MNTFLSISIVFILGLFVIKLFYEIKKLNTKINRLQDFLVEKLEAIDENKKDVEKNVSDSEILDAIEIKATNTNTEKNIDNPITKPQEPLHVKNTNHATPSKNSFLYDVDDFGYMEKGVVDESDTYGDGNIENSTSNKSNI